MAFDIGKFDAECNRRAIERVASRIVNILDASDGTVDNNFKKQKEIYKALGINDEENKQSNVANTIKQKVIDSLKHLFESNAWQDNLDIAQGLVNKLGLNFNIEEMLNNTFDQVHMEMMQEVNQQEGREVFVFDKNAPNNIRTRDENAYNRILNSYTQGNNKPDIGV